MATKQDDEHRYRQQLGSADPVRKLVMTVDYLFGRGVSKVIPAEHVRFEYSKRTGKIRSVLLRDKLFATFRPDGGLALTIDGAQILMTSPRFRQNVVVIADVARSFVAEGRSAFAKHVLKAGERIRPGAEVVVTDREGTVLAVGKAVLSARMMQSFRSGLAIKIRKGIQSRSEEKEVSSTSSSSRRGRQ